MKEVKVWDLFIRIFHWSLVGIILVNFTVFDEGTVHEMLGYILISLLALRFIWGFIGSKYALFKNFVPKPEKIKQHLRELGEGNETSYLGHNPLGAVMIYNLYITLLLVSFTGYLSITDVFWGVEWVEEVHELCANYLLLSVAIHVAGVIWETSRSGVNLISAMLTGIKKIP
ncbi:MAG: cytochrome b/b6 domain-containing protein [Emcibacter sp.]|nr:cytochrome b/b6 domain-containing protein [Emcibacter sp.]